MDESRSNVIFTVSPSLPGCLFWAVAVIPALLVPAAAVIYFTEGRNAAQFWAIAGFAAGLTGLLYGLLALTRRAMHRHARIEVTDDGTLRVWSRRGPDEVKLEEVDKMRPAVIRGSMTNLTFEMADGSRKSLAFAGVLAREEIEAFEAALKQFGVSPEN